MDLPKYVKPNYEATYSADFWKDYETLLYTEFYHRIANLEGNYKDVLNARNEYLNKPVTDYNKELQKQGKKLCTKNQIAQFINRKKKKMSAIHDMKRDYHKNEYLDYLKKRKVGE